MTTNRNHNVSNTIAQHDTVIFEWVCNYFGEQSFIVQNVMTNEFYCFEFDRWYGDLESRAAKAYESAARTYNSMVPDAEAVPLF